MEILNFKGPLLDLIYILKKGGSIHIKKKNRGKFTDYCGGKVTEECIAKGKKSKDPKIRKRATFAANARKWKHENGGIIKYQNPNSPLFNPHKIIENVPAREWGPRKINEDGTITEGNGTKFSRAPFQYWGNKGLGSQNEKLARDLVSEFDQMRSENPDYNYILDKNYQSYDDAINYLNHLEGLKKYLQIPYDTGLLMESEYKPTRLQGTNEKTYKFKSSTVPGYWDDVVDDMVIGEHDKNQYYDQSLNEFTAYRDRDEKGDFVSIYDEWDYNPAVRGGNKKLNKVVDSVTGGKPFVIYDRIYLDDRYDVPEEARGNPFITPAVVTANAKHENGGILKAQNGTPYGLPGGVPSYMQVQPLSPVGIALNQAKATAKMKGEQQHLPPGIKEVVGPNGKKVAIRTEQPLVPLEQDIAEWMPGTGDVAEVGYIANDVKNGNLGSATLGAGLLFLPGNAGKLLKTNVGKKISNFLNKDLFNYDELWAKIKHPTWKKYAHGSDDPFFDIKNADMGYNGEVGIHMTDDVPIAEVFAKGYSDRPGKVYEFYAPKPTLETIDATDNAANIYIGNVERLAGGTFNSSNTNTFFENLLKKYGGEDVIQDIPVDNSYREDLNFMFPGTGDNLKKYTLKQDVTIPTKDEIWPNKPEHVKKQFEELGKRWNQFKIDKKDAAREVSKILSDNGHKVLKYENVQPREGLKTAYVLTDPSIIDLINPEHQFKMKHALTGLGTGLGIGYGASQLKDE